MKKIILLVLFAINSYLSYSQSYLGKVTKQVNFREGAGKDYSIISSLKAGTQIFIISLDKDNDYYNIIDIATNKEGYIHSSFVKIGQLIAENDQGLFTSNGQGESYNPEIEIYNNTKLTMTLKLNNELHSFAPHEKRKITLSAGTCNYRASAPNVIPYIGSEYLKNNELYSWDFFIVTKRR